TGIPDNWTWTFEGGTPSGSNSPNPTVTWATAGTYNVTLTVSNIMGNDEVVKNDYITVTNSPIVCEYHSNIGDTEANVYYSTSGGFITGVNDYSFAEFAEFYDSHINNLIEGVRLYVAKAEVYSTDAIITMKIWDVASGKPGSELYSEDFDISGFSSFAYNEISFASATIVPEEFFIGYQVHYTTPQDTFAVLQAENRGVSPTLPTTAYIKYSGIWSNIDDVFQGDFNSSFAIAPYICPSPPTASFIADVTTGCDNLAVQFSNQSSANTDSWLWDFGDGNISTEQNPEHIYDTPGIYSVTLTSTNTLGSNVATQTDLIVIGTTPDPVIVSGGDIQCGGNITLTASGGGGGTIYFQGTTSGGESTLAASTSETISSSGTYYFRSQSADGCWSDEGSANLIINTIPDAVVVSGGGTQCGGNITLTASGGGGGTIYFQGTTSGGESSLAASTSETISSSGTYYFRSKSVEGCWGDEGSATITIFPELEISINSTTESNPGENDGTVTVSVLSGTPDYSYNWAIPVSEEIGPNLTGLSGGTYCLTVTDGNNCEATACETVNTENLTPVADFTANLTSGCDNLTVTFTDMSFNTPTSWAWSFGDGGTSDEQNPIYEYTASGLYTVTLIAGNENGDNEIIKEDYITIGEKPEINYIVTPATGEFTADGAISVSLSGGTEPYEVIWYHDAMETSLELVNLVPDAYYITVTENFNCYASETIEVYWTSTVGNETSSFSMYPNPTETQVTIAAGDEPILKLTIVNVLGEVIYEHIADNNAENFIISTKDFASGTYFIKVEFKDKSIIQKLIRR
ncbi:MAG: PKD domain-containing protein, partial [Bacteroidales bacterium]|nr:PKD domain-containing protein [Bacteroidales bacterium]